ncbi:MAG: methyltransferase domain-containing protein [Sphingomonadales bacterium]|nr:methyltransferase domain-containing protein [Sphingomonadales bacterium]
MRQRSKPRIWDTDWLVLKPLAQVIEQQVKRYARRGGSIIDLGCGDMPYKAIIESQGFMYRGADLDDSADLPIDEDGKVAAETGSTDAVLSVQVLEHVRNLDTYFSEIRRLLRDPDGVLFLSTHGTWLYHPHPEDHRRWTSTGLIGELENAGFQVDEIVPIAGPLATTTLIRQTGFVYFLDRVPIVGRIAGRVLTVIMNTRAMVEDKLTPESIRRDNACVYFVRARKCGR